MTVTEIDPIIETPPRSRRTVLAGALAGLGAIVASGIGRPAPLRAANGDPVILGQANTATTQTAISNTATNGAALQVNGNGAGNGINGYSPSGAGINGSSGSGVGVHGYSPSGGGVLGESTSGNGVSGYSSSNGVDGESVSSSASGVYGHNNYQGYGIAGRSNSPGLGVSGIYAAASLGENTAGGIGVWARSQAGVALYADAIDQASAIALKTRGVAQFSRSGKLTVLAGQSSVTKTGIRIEADSLVLAVLQQNRSGTWVRSAEPNAAGDSFTIRLNKAVAGDTKVGWFIVN